MKPVLYPSSCFELSPVYNTWVKLFCADVLQLQCHSGFESTNVYHWLNHPIYFVRLVGIVLSVDEHEHFALCTLDDGSGATLTLHVPASVGVRFNVGALVKVKGTVDKFREMRQLQVKRAEILLNPHEEYVAWIETVDFKRDVLSKPWVLDRIAPAQAPEVPGRAAHGMQANIQAQQKEAELSKKLVAFSSLPQSRRTIHSLKHHILEYIDRKNLTDFQISYLRADAEMEMAACLVGDSDQVLSAKHPAKRAFLALSRALDDLVEDGSIVQDDKFYISVGVRNISDAINESLRNAKRGKRTGKVYAREIWKRVRGRKGWEKVAKRVVLDVVGQAMSRQQGWSEGTRGVWTWDKI